jgi:hypothetical protein
VSTSSKTWLCRMLMPIQSLTSMKIFFIPLCACVMLLGNCYLAVPYSVSALATSGVVALLLVVPIVTVFLAAQLEW